eukprot:TRINITY_DN309_c0_g1_i3.p4 TRINITY_DN309_c0_g1~~TRINITY_DN309_c0_g1_i3.p4  ORF type:complete len:75 (+),score=17.81 TRINITY_DN309_c0_g1_i3:491-715(+)
MARAEKTDCHIRKTKQQMLGVGFEPTHPEILELESSALDRSAIQARWRASGGRTTPHMKNGPKKKKVPTAWPLV